MDETLCVATEQTGNFTRRQVNYFVCVAFSISIIAITFCLVPIGSVRSAVYVGFAILLLAYVHAYKMGLTPSWTEHVVAALAAGTLMIVTVFGISGSGILVVFLVAPSFAFLAYSTRVGATWSTILFVCLCYSLFVSDRHNIQTTMRLGLVSGFILTSVVSGVASAVLAIANDRIVRADQRIKELERVLTICMDCRTLRQETEWLALEQYLRKKEGTLVSHGLCPKCFETRMSETIDS